MLMVHIFMKDFFEEKKYFEKKTTDAQFLLGFILVGVNTCEPGQKPVFGVSNTSLSATRY